MTHPVYSVQQAEYDALDARALVVTQEREIDAALLAHYVSKYSDHPTAAATIRRLNISPHILAPLPFLMLNPMAIDAVRHVVGDQELWRLVRAAWAALLRIPALELNAHADQLDRRLETTAAELGLAGQSAPAPRIPVRLRLPSAAVSDRSAVVATSVPAPHPPLRFAAASVPNCSAGDSSLPQESPFALVSPSPTPPPLFKFGKMIPGASISVHYSRGYHCTRGDRYGAGTALPHQPVCHFRGCAQEWPIYTLRQHGSLSVYFLCNWKTYCCFEHLDVLADFAQRSVLFCHSCGVLESVSYYWSTCGRLTVPLCIECTKKPYVMRQFEIFLRRCWRLGIGKGRRDITTYSPLPSRRFQELASLPASEPAGRMARPLEVANVPAPKKPRPPVAGSSVAETQRFGPRTAAPNNAGRGALMPPTDLDSGGVAPVVIDIDDESTDRGDDGTCSDSDNDYFPQYDDVLVPASSADAPARALDRAEPVSSLSSPAYMSVLSSGSTYYRHLIAPSSEGRDETR